MPGLFKPTQGRIERGRVKRVEVNGALGQNVCRYVVGAFWR